MFYISIFLKIENCQGRLYLGKYSSKGLHFCSLIDTSAAGIAVIFHVSPQQNVTELVCGYAAKRIWNFTFMLPCIVTNFFLIKPTDALIFPNLFLSRNSTCFGQFLCPSSGVLHSTFGTGICHASLMTAFKHVQDGRAWKLSTNLHDVYQCRTYSGELLMMGRGTAFSWQK